MSRTYCLLLLLIPTVLGDLAFIWNAIQNASSNSRSQDEFTTRQLLARTKAAAGGVAWDHVRSVHVKWNAQEGGLNGVVQETSDLAGARYTDASNFGVRTGAYGFNGKVVWSQDSSGLSQIEEGADALEGTVNEAYRRSLAYWYAERWPAEIKYVGQDQDAGLQFHVLSITPERGRPFALWFDATTYLLARVVEKTGTGLIKVFFEDYREIENLKVSFRVQVQLTSGAENVYQAEKIEFNWPISDARFNIPLSRRRIFS